VEASVDQAKSDAPNPLQYSNHFPASLSAWAGDDAPDVVATALARELVEAATALLATVDLARVVELSPADRHLRRRQVERRARRVRAALTLFLGMVER
jgi:hypothetical protein